MIAELRSLRTYVRGRGLSDAPAEREARIREHFGRIFATLISGAPDGMFTQAINEYVATMLTEMQREAPNQPSAPGAEPPSEPESDAPNEPA